MRGLDFSTLAAGQQRSAWLDAQNPVYGRPNWNRFRALMDNLGNSYAQDFFIYTAKLGAMNANASAIAAVQIEKNSAFDLIALCGGATTAAANALSTNFNVNFQIVDGAGSRNLFSSAVPMANFLGGGASPFTLPIIRRFMPATQITVTASNIDTNNLTDCQVSFIGRKLFMDAMPGQRQAPPPRFNAWRDQQTGTVYTEDFFIYDFSIPTLASQATTPVTVIIQADSDFEWIMSSFTAAGDSVGSPTSPPLDGNATPILVQVFDGGSGRNIFNQAVPVGFIAGSAVSARSIATAAGAGIDPFVLPQPRIFLAKTPVTVTFTNASTTVFDILHFSMIGRKIFAQD
jgi:hypothetical protein